MGAPRALSPAPTCGHVTLRRTLSAELLTVGGATKRLQKPRVTNRLARASSERARAPRFVASGRLRRRRQTPVGDEEASAGARSAPASLLHPGKGRSGAGAIEFHA